MKYDIEQCKHARETFCQTGQNCGESRNLGGFLRAENLVVTSQASPARPRSASSPRRPRHASQTVQQPPRSSFREPAPDAASVQPGSQVGHPQSEGSLCCPRYNSDSDAAARRDWRKEMLCVHRVSAQWQCALQGRPMLTLT